MRCSEECGLDYRLVDIHRGIGGSRLRLLAPWLLLGQGLLLLLRPLNSMHTRNQVLGRNRSQQIAQME